MPATLTGNPGDTVHLPISIDDAAGLSAIQVEVYYPTEHLQVADADLTRGSVIPAAWMWMTNADDPAVLDSDSLGSPKSRVASIHL
jgi:hypothetical protein